MIPCSIQAIYSRKQHTKLFAVYSHKDADGKVQFIGICRLHRVFYHPDALTNTEWVRIFGDPSAIIDLEVNNLFETLQEATAYRRELFRAYLPPCNFLGVYQGNSGDIVCVTTGERFSTLKECCAAHNLTMSQLNNHVLGKPGHKTVKGKIYKRVAS